MKKPGPPLSFGIGVIISAYGSSAKYHTFLSASPGRKAFCITPMKTLWVKHTIRTAVLCRMYGRMCSCLKASPCVSTWLSIFYSPFWPYPSTLRYNGNTMSKRQVIMLLGIWTMAIPFLGFPDAWDRVIFSFTGLLIILLSYTTGSAKTGPKSPGLSGLPFVEHRNREDDGTITSGSQNQR